LNGKQKVFGQVQDTEIMRLDNTLFYSTNQPDDECKLITGEDAWTAVCLEAGWLSDLSPDSYQLGLSSTSTSGDVAFWAMGTNSEVGYKNRHWSAWSSRG
ncbi:hypothetical protein LTR96_011780, partial [Exophiala xenobiotica]